MNMISRLGVVSVGPILTGILFADVVTSTAWATPKDYCLAYARDFADTGPKDEKTWTTRHDNALADCLFQYQSVTAESPKVPRRKVVKAAPKPAVKPKPVEAVETADVEPLPEPAVIVAPDIEPPQKPAKVTRSAQPTPSAQPTKKTLLAKFFPRKAAAVAVPEASGKLTPGSPAWLDYCENKYASFNRETGTYQSYKGIERKCRVTD
jgi:outer membrane biosynthesis protein TonB